MLDAASRGYDQETNNKEYIFYEQSIYIMIKMMKKKLLIKIFLLIFHILYFYPNIFLY